MTARDLHERHGNEELRRRALTRAHSHLPSRTMRLFVPLERRALARQLHPPVGMVYYALDQTDVQCIIILALYADRTYIEPMDLRRLRTFVAVAELGTVSESSATPSHWAACPY
jgi:hypothetical protein